MAKYELVVSAAQPTCGGQSPRDVEVQSVTCDDPVEYVKKQVPGAEITVDEMTKEHVVISYLDQDGPVTYDFTLDD